MALAEKMGDKDYFKAEKRLAQMKKKAAAESEREVRRQENAEKHDVFNVINCLQRTYGAYAKTKQT